MTMHTTLVDTATLAAHLDDPSWVVMDCRFALTDPTAGRRAYDSLHVPGARYAHLDDDLSAPVTPGSGRHPLPPAARLAERIGQWGIDRATQVVVYDDSAGTMAGRLWWLLRWLGHERCALLDGGFQKWQHEQLPSTPEILRPVPSHFIPAIDAALWVDTDFVQNILGDGRYRILDARAAERFRGEVEPIDKVAGHIPGAVCVPLQGNLGVDGTFLSPGALRARYLAEIADVPPSNVIVMCGSGVTACHNILAMEHAGLHGARLYAGSWSEWIGDPQRPVAKGA